TTARVVVAACSELSSRPASSASSTEDTAASTMQSTSSVVRPLAVHNADSTPDRAERSSGGGTRLMSGAAPIWSVEGSTQDAKASGGMADMTVAGPTLSD